MRWVTLIIFTLLLYWGLSKFADSVGLAENDTATSTNILPNAGTTSSNMDNFNLDGVNSGTGNLSNNSTHNGFTITCGTTIEGHCGKAFNGELESSRDMKVSASDTLVGVTGTESGTTYTATQNKLDGGIILNSYFSVQNCEDGSSSFSCGASSGADDSYVLHLKIKDADGNTLADMTTTRLDDAGYNTNSAKFEDSLTWNGTGGASYEWYWQGFDGQQSTSALRGPNLLGAELLLDFPTEDHEALTTQEIANINEALNTTELTENEIYDIISGLESIIEEEFFASGNLEENNRIEISLEEGLIIEVASKETGALVMESPMVQEIFNSVMEEMPIETLKEEMVAMVQEEEMPFNAMMEEVSTPTMEEPPEEEPQTIKGSPMMEEASTPKEELETQEPTKEASPTMTAQLPETPKENKEEIKEEKKEMASIKEANEKKETIKKKKSNSPVATKKKISTKDNKEQKKIQKDKQVVKNMERIMDKIDTQVKDVSKNLELKNLIKAEAMTNDQVSLASYNKPFYKSKNIYLDAAQMKDLRNIYSNVDLTTYSINDPVSIYHANLTEAKSAIEQLEFELGRMKWEN